MNSIFIIFFVCFKKKSFVEPKYLCNSSLTSFFRSSYHYVFYSSLISKDISRRMIFIRLLPQGYYALYLNNLVLAPIPPVSKNQASVRCAFCPLQTRMHLLMNARINDNKKRNFLRKLFPLRRSEAEITTIYNYSIKYADTKRNTF